MIRYADIHGMRVLTVDDARQIGTLGRPVIDTAAGRIVGFELSGADTGANRLPLSRISSLGPDALMVASSDDAVQADADGGAMPLTDLLGRRVFNDRGDMLGELEDIEFDEHDGVLLRLYVAGHAIPLGRLVVGPDAVIVRAP